MCKQGEEIEKTQQQEELSPRDVFYPVKETFRSNLCITSPLLWMYVNKHRCYVTVHLSGLLAQEALRRQFVPPATGLSGYSPPLPPNPSTVAPSAIKACLGTMDARSCSLCLSDNVCERVCVYKKKNCLNKFMGNECARHFMTSVLQTFKSLKGIMIFR